MRNDDDDDLPRIIAGVIVFVVFNLGVGMLIAHWILWR
jgi:hypothetical protein